VAGLDATSGTLRAAPNAAIYGQVYALATGNGRLYLGGRITSVGSQVRANLAALSLSSGALDGTWTPRAEGRVEALVYTSGRVYAGRIFSNVNGVTRTQKIAALNPTSGAVDTGFRSRVYVVVHGLRATGDSLYAATGGQGGRGYRMDLSGAVRWQATMDGDIQAVVVLGDTVYWGGHFDRVGATTRTGSQGVCLDGSVSRIKVAATTVSGTLSSWAPQANGVHGVFGMAASAAHAQIAMGGEFTTVSGVTHRRFAQFGM
jgi:hypothetical protein